MCGIFGQFGLSAVDKRQAFTERAFAALSRRGPDGRGCWDDSACLLGHTRLAIIDLSDGGKQPMASATGATVVAFNGEVYNYLELREILVPPPGGWRSSSDTEVLVEGFEQEGVSFLERVVGMFAAAFYTPATRELVIARDRLGKKPLFYSLRDGGLTFASEIGALVGNAPATSEDRLAEYLQHGYIASPRTGFVDVHALPPGSLLLARWTGKEVESSVRRWWTLPAYEPMVSRDAWTERLAELLDSAVRLRLRSDVPLGCFLSGGVDSSVVTLLATRAAANIKTFTVNFDEAGFGEGAYAAEVAQHLGVQHEVLRIDSKAVASLADIVAVYGELHGDSSAIPTLALCRTARQAVTVALAGDGGDELLGGYARYQSSLRDTSRLRLAPELALSAARRVGRLAVPHVRGATRLARLSADLQTYYPLEVRSYLDDAWPRVLRRRSAACWPDAVQVAVRDNRSRPPLFQMTATDVATYLPEDILVKVDRASMSCGLEVRAPLLDHRLFEWLSCARPEWIADRGGAKRPLRELYSAALPPNVFSRKKMGFGVPLQHWFRRDLAQAGDRLSTRRMRELLVPSAVEALLRRHSKGADESSRIWHLLVLAAWLEQWRPTVQS